MNKTVRLGWERWKKLAKRIGKFQARIIFSILYFIVVTPIGYISGKKTTRKNSAKPQWSDYTDQPNSLSEMTNQ